MLLSSGERRSVWLLDLHAILKPRSSHILTLDRSTAMSSGEDGSVRLWDTEEVTQKMVIKPTLLKPGRVSVSTCAFTADGYGIGAALTDGTLQTWDTRGALQNSLSLYQMVSATADGKMR